MTLTRQDYLTAFLQHCIPAAPTFDLLLADGDSVALDVATLIDVAVRRVSRDDWINVLVPPRAVVATHSVGRGLLLLGYQLLDDHLHRTFSDRRIPFAESMFSTLDWLELSNDTRGRLGKRLIFTLGDLLAMPAEERIACLNGASWFDIVEALQRCGISDSAPASWPARRTVVPVQLSDAGRDELGAIELRQLPLPRRVSQSLIASGVTRLSDLTFDRWQAVKDSARWSEPVEALSESVLADFGRDFAGWGMVRPDDRLFVCGGGLAAAKIK